MTHSRSSLLLLGLFAIHLWATLALPQTLVLDLDPEPGDQGQREAWTDRHTRLGQVQLHLAQAPPFSVWSAQLSFDPAQVRCVEGGQTAGNLFPGQEIQVALPEEGSVVLGGTHSGQHLVSGEGDLAQLEVETLPQAAGPIRLWISAFRLESPEWSTEVPVAAEVWLRVPGVDTVEEPPTLLALSGEAARSHLLAQRACAGCDLRRQDLAQLDLSQVDLRQAVLEEATLLKTNLQQADLRGARLRGAVFLQADLREARFQGSQLAEARLGGAKLAGADFTGAALDTLGLQGVNLAGAIWVDGRTCGAGSFGRCR